MKRISIVLNVGCEKVNSTEPEKLGKPVTNLQFEKLITSKKPDYLSNHYAMEDLWFKEDGREGRSAYYSTATTGTSIFNSLRPITTPRSTTAMSTSTGDLATPQSRTAYSRTARPLCTDFWQYSYSAKQRIGHLMDAYADKVRIMLFGGNYRPVMSEMEALECLQAGSFAIEVPGDATDWSCIYNPAQKTILFNMRNDMSKIYKIDFEKDFL